MRFRLCLFRLTSRDSRAGNHHLFPADDTHAISQPIHVLLRRIRVLGVHIPRCAPIADQVRASGYEGSESHPDVSEDMEGDTVIEEDDGEEREVGEEFGKVYISAWIRPKTMPGR
jgi:hypothetical protein